MLDEQTLIIGAGPIGIACAISAKRDGRDPLLIDAGSIVNSIVHYPVGMVFFTTPELLEIGGHPLVCSGQKPTREEAMMYYRGVVRADEIRSRTHTRLLEGHRTEAGIECLLSDRTGDFKILCQHLTLATGYYDNPKPLGIPGEDLPHVSHYFDEPHLGFERDIVVIGGKNSAIEAALDLFRAGARVTIIYRKSEFPKSVKYWIRPDIINRIKAGEIEARLESEVVSIGRDAVTITGPDGAEETIKADRVYALTGFLPDTDLFRRLGINIASDTGRPEHDDRTLETNVPGVYVAGSIKSGYRTSDIFIENGRFDGEVVFGGDD